MNFLSRYRPRYVRSLVYMMQASEYYVHDYFRWYHRTRDFSRVEYRKQLDMTAKAKILLFGGWALVILILLVGALVAGYMGLIVSLIALPFILPYGLAGSLVILNALQRPVENRIIARAKKKLSEHKGIRIAIAGSFGKTSMREILKTVLSPQKKVAAPGGSRNTPLALAEFIESLSGKEDILIFELGEYYPGDIKKLCDFIDPQWGIITGINEAHLERFGTLDKTIATVFELADHSPHKPLYVNGESIAARTRATAEPIIYDRTGSGDWRVLSARSDLAGLHIEFEHDGKTHKAFSQLLGLHNVGPIAAAADIASHLGIADESIISAIAKTESFEHRMQPRSDSGVTLIDDSYNGNPDGVGAAIDFLAGLKGRRWYVTPGLVEMGGKTEEVHKEIGRKLAEAGIEKVVLIRDSVTPFIEEGLKKAGYKGEVIWYDNGPSAYAALPSMTVTGDIVLLQNDWPDQYV